MTWNDFFQSVKAGKLDRVYLFTGPEEWIKREAVEALRAKLLPPGLEQLNDASLEEVTAQQIIDAAETLPMMCERRMVVVRDWAPLLPGKSKNEETETEKLKNVNNDLGTILAENLQGALPAIALDGHFALSTAWISTAQGSIRIRESRSRSLTLNTVDPPRTRI